MGSAPLEISTVREERMPLDVTEQVQFGYIDNESMPLHKCVCGKKFDGWDQVLSMYENDAWQCDGCGRKLFFRCHVSVFQVTD